MNALSRETFFELADDYCKRLSSASSFSDILELWRSTSFPYSLDETDPYSPQYRDEVLEVYKRLSGSSYDVANEWTSNKQSAEDFEIGYPWLSRDFGVIAEEIAKPIQILRILQAKGKQDLKVIEFGSGWGNLAIPLAKSGVDIALVDIDQGFLERAARIANREGVSVRAICGDFLDVARDCQNEYDVAIFQSSFHHCLEFAELTQVIRDKVLNSNGEILFVNEPISEEISFPWGLRYDGESLWAIMCNKWLELGFHSDFFSEMLIRNGFLPVMLPGIPSLLGEGWKAVKGVNGADFCDLRLPRHYSDTFHEADGGSKVRFTRETSMLPATGPEVSAYNITFVNFSLKQISWTLNSGAASQLFTLSSGERVTISWPAMKTALEIVSETFVPDQQTGSGDVRVLGVALERIELIC